MATLDPRTHPYRADLAAEHLRGSVDAERYSSGVRKTVIKGVAPLRRAPRMDASLETELLFGESVTVFDEKDGWSWLQADTDSYVGYALSETLGADTSPPTHHVAVLRSYIFPEPDLKTPPLDLLSMTAAVRVTGQNGAYSALDGSGWIYSRHLAPVGDNEADHCGVAIRFLGAPYLWGGKTSVGLDCSGLIQVSLARCGQSVPRDTDMQEQEIGTAVVFAGDQSVLQRGDLVFWPGHAGIWIDPNRFVHANATDMMVAVAPLSDVAAYIEEATGHPIRTVRRPAMT